MVIESVGEINNSQGHLFVCWILPFGSSVLRRRSTRIIRTQNIFIWNRWGTRDIRVTVTGLCVVINDISCSSGLHDIRTTRWERICATWDVTKLTCNPGAPWI